MTIIVTGAAGFVGANNVKALNARGRSDIVAVDNLDARRQVPQSRRLRHRRLPRQERVPRARAPRRALPKPDVVFHQGACSDTMETDGRYMLENNYRYSVELLKWCQARARAADLCLVGRGLRRSARCSSRAARNEKPLNVYGYSKFLFDQVRPPRGSPSLDCAGRRPALFQRLRTARSHTRAAWHRSPTTTSTSFAPKAGSSCSRAAMATPTASSGAISSTSTTWCAVNLHFWQQSAKRHLQRRHRAGAELQRRRARGRQHDARPTRNEPALGAWRRPSQRG